MEPQGRYGSRIAELIGVQDAPSILVRGKKKAEIAITRIKSDRPNHEKSSITPAEDAFVAVISMREGLHREYWVEGRALPPQKPQPAGVATVADHRQQRRVRFLTPFDMMQFYFARRALNSILDNESARAIHELAAPTHTPMPDPILHHLAVTLIPALARPNEASRLFVDHVTLAAAMHFIKQYGHVALPERAAKGGLAPWQEIRAREMLESALDGEISLTEVAAQCRLSTRHFSRAFAKSMGIPPHRYLLKRRVERAKELLRCSNDTLAEIAPSCGFADQSHLVRVFTQTVGESPGAWRRSIRC